MNGAHAHSDAEIAALWRALRERRDVRHFVSGVLPDGLLKRLIEAAYLAPSADYMQPWRFLHIRPNFFFGDQTWLCQLAAQARPAGHAVSEVANE
ncbi:MAG: hypothetical protein CVU17_10405 [Betaproteobacteria bacterium HGW-Betaproteobacteria-11]|nr:MAG: hypothetical protein CVU17_10405 [Betaproteobacteria bacterium HGW-Betaproteobacteria-11]